MNETKIPNVGSKRRGTSTCGSRFLIACCIAVTVFSGPAWGQRLRETESELPRAGGLSLQVEATADGVVLRRPQDVIAHIRSLPGVYAGATDPILAVSFRADGWRRGEGSWVHEPLDCRTAGGEAHVVANRLSPAVLFELPDAAAMPESGAFSRRTERAHTGSGVAKPVRRFASIRCLADRWKNRRATNQRVAGIPAPGFGRTLDAALVR